jgi:hypothetical protein
MPDGFGVGMRSSRWLLQVVFPVASTGKISSYMMAGLLKTHRSPEYRECPQIVVVVSEDSRGEKAAPTWNKLQLQFDTLVVATVMSRAEWDDFDEDDLRRLIDKHEKTRQNAAKLEVVLSQKEMIVAAHSAMDNISSVKRMINDMINNVAAASKYFMAGDALVSPSERRLNCKLDLSGFPAKLSAAMRGFWDSSLQRVNAVSDDSEAGSDLVIRMVYVNDFNFTLAQYRPAAVGFLFHLFLVERSEKDIPPQLYDRIYTQSFQMGLHYDVISCIPSLSNLESTLECTLRNGKDALEAHQMMAGIDTSQPEQAAEADVDRIIDETVAQIKQAKNDN